MYKDFSQIPQVRFNRSKFRMPHGVKTTMNVGTLYPIHCQEVLPGDTFKSDISMVARVTSAFLKPVIDNAFMDIYTFFVPLRLVYNDLEKVFGDPSPSAYSSNTLASIPTFEKSIDVAQKSVYDYLGLPIGKVPAGVSIAPARAFALIYDKWFRNENVVNEVFVQKGEIVASETPNANPWAPNNYTGLLPKVSKRKDYFTSCLPKPQKGANVTLPLGISAPLNATVSGNNQPLKLNSLETGNTVQLVSPSGDIQTGGYGSLNFYSFGTIGNQNNFTYNSGLGVTGTADLTNATAANVNDLRFAFQLQKMLERDALYGTRYNEYLLAHFGVTSPDSRLQLPEYLGGGRIPISVQQVAQTSEATTTSPLANVAGFSLTNGHTRFAKGFTEHGYIITVACIRTMHTYQQGVPKMFFRSTRNDFYDPLFSSLGEQPVYTSQLFVDGSETSLKDNVFGYNEAWADYRYIPSRISGELRSAATNSLDIWHFGDKYASAPTLSQSFVEETSANIDRTLAVPSTSQDNFLVDFYFDTQAIRVMPTYSVPGLIDHH